MRQKPTSSMMSLAENLKLETKKLFALQTKRLAKSCESLNSWLSSAIGLGVMPLLRHMKTAWL